MGQVLRKGTTRCPKDKEPLHFASMYGLRLYSEADGRYLYSATCPKCSKDYAINRGKTP